MEAKTKTWEECVNAAAETVTRFDHYDNGRTLGTKDAIVKKAAQIYARECCQASLNKAAENAENKRYIICGEVKTGEIDKSSIIDPSNYVLL